MTLFGDGNLPKMPWVVTLSYDVSHSYDHEFVLFVTDEEYVLITCLDTSGEFPPLNVRSGHGNDSEGVEVSFQSSTEISESTYQEMEPILNNRDYLDQIKQKFDKDCGAWVFGKVFVAGKITSENLKILREDGHDISKCVMVPRDEVTDSRLETHFYWTDPVTFKFEKWVTGKYVREDFLENGAVSIGQKLYLLHEASGAEIDDLIKQGGTEWSPEDAQEMLTWEALTPEPFENVSVCFSDETRPYKDFLL
jgi:hypothetical protein